MVGKQKMSISPTRFINVNSQNANKRLFGHYSYFLKVAGSISQCLTLNNRLLMFFPSKNVFFVYLSFFKAFSRFFPLNIMLRVSFSPGRDRACRHCCISSFWTPSGKQRLCFSRGHLFKPPLAEYVV